MPDGIARPFGVDNPHYLGPTIVATKDQAVRIVFYNLLPKGADGDLFLPTDTCHHGLRGHARPSWTPPVNDGTVMDEVRNPMCTEKYFDPAMRDMCFTENRATLHLHGGVTPWISDGTPHQWITPANETTPWPQGVAVGNVPDMAPVAGVPDCTAANDGCQTFYYTNQQSARLMFYHDHAWGITRLNVYAGEAAGYRPHRRDRAEADRRRRRSRRPRCRHPARHPGPHLRSVRRAARRAGPDVGRLQVGRHG